MTVKLKVPKLYKMEINKGKQTSSEFMGGVGNVVYHLTAIDQDKKRPDSTYNLRKKKMEKKENSERQETA